MSAFKTLLALKASQLRHAAFLMGVATTGTKSELVNAIRVCIHEPSNSDKKATIVSVDMGIKNLGICVLETSSLVKASKANQDKYETPSLKVIAWKKIDVLSSLASQARLTTNVVAALEPHSPSKDGRRRTDLKKAAIDANVFRPSILSKTAYTIARDLLCKYNASHILIERQRFRSGGASAVQEWTLRVNMLESMIWACLETMRYEESREHESEKTLQLPAVHEVNPARVAKFWCSAPAETGTYVPLDLFEDDHKTSVITDAETKRKIDKKDKIAVVRSWLSDKSDKIANSTNVMLQFTSQTQTIANSFRCETKKRSKSETATNGTSATGKLDDLADCLLQGVAWVRWEENRRKIRDMLDPGDKQYET